MGYRSEVVLVVGKFGSLVGYTSKKAKSVRGGNTGYRRKSLSWFFRLSGCFLERGTSKEIDP